MSDKNEAIRLKLLKAQSLFSEVDVLMQNKFYITTVNRIYYSCFHATKALLLTKDLSPKTHSRVVTLLNQHFVQQGIFDFAQASFFSRIMQECMEDD